MRAFALPSILLVSSLSCQTRQPEGAELTRAQCAELVRHVQRLESADTGGMREALNVGLRSGVDGCLEKGTDRAYRCVMSAEAQKDLGSCDLLFR